MSVKITREIKSIIIILIAFYFIVSRLFKKEWLKQKEREAMNKPVSKKTQDQIFRELQKTLKSSAVTKPVESGPEHVQRTTLNRPNLNESRKANSQLKKSPLKVQKSMKAIPEKKEVISQNDLRNEILEDFDPRKAIVLSEILNRPQY